MIRMLTPLALAGTAVALLAPTAPAASQNKVSEVIVYGTDPCPRSTDDNVVVCARRPESERYRIPERLRSGGPKQSRESWASRARTLETVGNTGTNSCSAVGPGGFTGCMQKLINQARRERKEQAQGEQPVAE